MCAYRYQQVLQSPVMRSIAVEMRLVVPDAGVVRTFAVSEGMWPSSVSNLVCMAFGWESYLSRMTVDGKIVLDPRILGMMVWEPPYDDFYSDVRTIDDLRGREVIVRPDDDSDVTVSVTIGDRCDIPVEECPALLSFEGGVPDLTGRMRHKPMRIGTDMLSRRSLSQRILKLRKEDNPLAYLPEIDPASVKGTRRLRITLDDTEPVISRTVDVPADISFLDLHDIIQTAMGWYDVHLHSFSVPGRRLVIEDIPEGEDGPFGCTVIGEDTPIAMFEGIVLRYTYDFGDDWIHTIEWMRSSDKPSEHPRLVAWKGVCPPEDCGGVWGYRDFMKIMGNPRDPRRKGLAEWAAEAGYGEWSEDAVRRTFEVWRKGSYKPPY